jgi:hypothetical protein
MDRFRIIGKTKQMTSIYLLNEEGKIKQHRILLGKQIEVDENQLTFHVQRLLGKKAIQLINLGPVEEKTEVVEIEKEVVSVEEEEWDMTEEKAPAVEIVEIESEEAVAPKLKKGRGRKKKSSAE